MTILWDHRGIHGLSLAQKSHVARDWHVTVPCGAVPLCSCLHVYVPFAYTVAHEPGQKDTRQTVYPGELVLGVKRAG